MRQINKMLLAMIASAPLIGPLPAHAQSVNWTWTNQYGSTLQPEHRGDHRDLYQQRGEQLR